MKKLPICFSLIILMAFACEKHDTLNAPPPIEDEFIRAVDISSLPEIRLSATRFYNPPGLVQSPLETLKSSGVNTVRVRLWVDPSSQHSSLTEVSSFCTELRQKGFRIWLSLHYSDTWADPGHQEKPSRWTSLNYSELLDSVYAYTSEVAGLLKPEIIQIGNEVNNGFLFPEGSYTKPQQFNELLQQGINAAKASSPASKIMIHYAGHKNALYFFSNIDSLDFDLIGLSYYPIWHGKNLDSLKHSIDNLGTTFKRNVIIAETAYPFTLDYNDWTNNIVGLSEQLLTEFPASLEGQKDYLSRLRSLISESKRGMGFCYWGAELLAWKGPQSTSASPWENQALWDFDNRAVPAMEVFEKTF